MTSVVTGGTWPVVTFAVHEAPAHTHSFTYAASGATITATCTAAGCTLPPSTEGGTDHVATLTIAAPTTGGGAAAVTVTPDGAITGYTVKYQTKSNGTWTDAANAPAEAGFHKASVTLTGTNNNTATATVTYGVNAITVAGGIQNGTVTAPEVATVGATVELTITPSAGYQLDTLTVKDANNQDVTVTDNTFIMPESSVTVNASFKEITYTVAVDETNGAKATVKDSLPTPNTWTAELTGLPANKTYDGEPANLTAATVQKSANFPDDKVTVGAVSFKDQNNNTVTTAKNVGTYTASATVGDKTISKAFTIQGRTPSITYVESTERVGNNIVISLTTTNQYLPLLDNPTGITLLEDGETYVANGNIAIGALVFVGDVNLILCKNTTVTIYAGIYHIGSKLNIYTEEGAEGSGLIVKGNKTLASLDNYANLNGQTISDANAALSGTIGVYGGKLTVEQGNSNLVSDDINLTLGAGIGSNGLTGGTENTDGSMTYGKAAFASLTTLAVKPVAIVTTAPTAKTLTYNGQAQELVTAGEATGGEMQYAIGADDQTAPTSGWDTSIPTATDAGTYYVWYYAKSNDDDHSDCEAVCVPVAILEAYTVTFKNYDGSILESKLVPIGETPVYDFDANGTPTKPSSASTHYTFTGWNPALTPMGTKERTYIAQYSPTTRSYPVLFMNGDGTVLQKTEELYGATPAYKGATPTKLSDEEYDYSFAGWTPEFDTVRSRQEYTATYTKSTRSYTVLFKDEDGTELQKTSELYGATPEYKGATPTKLADEEFDYAFDGWTPKLEIVKGAQVYTARYSKITRSYEVVFKDEDGTVLQKTSELYGATPEYKGATPTKLSDEEFDYAFAGWSPAIADVTADATYTATYTATAIPAFGPATFTLPASTMTVGESAFEGLSMAVVEIPDGCTSIGKWAFKDCTKLTQIRIPASVTSIDTTAFEGCTDVFIYGTAGSAAQTFCDTHLNCTFVTENTGA